MVMKEVPMLLKSFVGVMLLTSFSLGAASGVASHRGGLQGTRRPSADAADAEGWKPLFDGKSLGNWKRTEFAGGGEVRVEKSFRGGPPAVVVEAGSALSGFHWTRQ